MVMFDGSEAQSIAMNPDLIIPREKVARSVDTADVTAPVCHANRGMEYPAPSGDLTIMRRGTALHDDEEKLKKTVDWVLDALSLTDVSEQRVGDAMQRGISGGQKRRVCIGRALVATPGALFMDEPTSGLSATDSLLVMKCIQRITRSFEIIVAAVIHQPRYDVFRRFDQLILLTNGRVAYNGVRSEAIKHFTKINAAYECPAYVSPADHFLDLVTPPVKHSTKDEEKGLLAEEGEIEKTPKHVIITEYFEKNCRKDVEAKVDAIKPGQAVGATISYRPDAEHTAPLSRQIKELLKREIKLNFRDPQKITAKAANAFIMGLLIGAMYYDVKAQYVPAFGYIGLAIVSMSAMVSLPSFYADRLMFNLERMDRLYPTLPFFLVTTGVGLLVSVIFNVLFSVIVWGMTGLGWTHFGRFALIGFTIFWATDGLITWISGACRTMDQAMATFNMTIGIFLLFNGFSANTKTTPYWLNWLCFCSPLYYSLEMFLDTLYGGTEKWAITGELYGMQEHAFWRDFFICLGIGVLGRIMGFFAMKYMHRIQR
eukprot:CAMPEP_0167753498 /NCGR_PEP_ID=MMETSP0110_2-20121227/7747_1 /TAXON_ID=629695 /ORGANISM="Gymnochlora sp., Strain CCMP2014" /LENGTH=541 /DNA_ID=CAMNT_0007639271 /DNA_START=746 /DNA_END=2371 /DNA_ORIENTATION=-